MTIVHFPLLGFVVVGDLCSTAAGYGEAADSNHGGMVANGVPTEECQTDAYAYSTLEPYYHVAKGEYLG